ncbi:hypothetical protein V7150_18015, partial [Neobacillus drentensis]|uniref:hypothetical protein n=1 Tax=Neobacillus drentensis TaxID=220684 RepID=UPI003000DA6B
NIAFTCPNTRLIQTGQQEYCFRLSEYKAHSDKITGILLSPVRIQDSFRQDKRKIAITCPNEGIKVPITYWFLNNIKERMAWRKH